MPYVTSGPRTMIGHATWEGRELQSGDAVFLEVGGCYRRYHTAMMRTALLHDMTPAMEHAQERMTTALSELKAVLRHHRLGRRLDRAPSSPTTTSGPSS